MSIITQRFDTGLRNLKGTETGARRQPPITKSIPDSRTSLGIGSNLSLQVSKRADDTVRMTRLLGRPEGIKFISNQALLNQNALTSAITRGERPSGRQAAIGAARTAGVPASAITQAGVSGTGLRFIQGGVPANGGYLSEGNLLRGALSSINPFGSGDNQIAKGGIALRGETINDFSVRSKYPESEDTEPAIEPITFKGIELNRTTVPRPEERQDDTFIFQDGPSSRIEIPMGQASTYLGRENVIRGKEATGSFDDSSVQSSYEGLGGLNTETKKAGLDQVEDAKKVGEENKDDSKRPLIKGIREGEKVHHVSIGSITENPLENRFFITSQDGKKLERDEVNILDVQTDEIDEPEKQIIPFNFKVYPGSDRPEFLFFRAYLESLGDNYSGNWTSTNYIGRADPVFTYDNFSRGISFSFKIAAFSKADLKPLYDKLNRLASTTAPHYENNGFFKQGVFVEVTIGDYLKKVPGFFQSVDVNWDINYPWEVEDSGRKVPHILDVNCSFQPIHDFNAQYGEGFNFIGPVETLAL